MTTCYLEVCNGSGIGNGYDVAIASDGDTAIVRVWDVSRQTAVGYFDAPVPESKEDAEGACVEFSNHCGGEYSARTAEDFDALTEAIDDGFVADVLDRHDEDDRQAISDLTDDELLELAGGLADQSKDSQNRGGADATYTATWVESSEQMTWDLPCFLLDFGTRVVMWSCTDAAGVDDVTVAKAQVLVEDQLKAFADDLASNLAY